MSLSKPSSSSSEVKNKEDKGRFHITLPQAYGYLTIAQAGSAIVFSTFLVTHLSATTLANFGGIGLTNKSIVLGRVYYQNPFLEPIVVFGSFWLHVVTGAAKRGIRLFWKHKKQDQRKLTGEIHEKVEKIVSDELNDKGEKIRQKITTRTTTTITTSFISRATESLLPFHQLTGYLLIPAVSTHFYINRILPKRHFGDSSLINASYVTLALKRWPKSTYIGFSLLIGLAAYHVYSGIPAVIRTIRGALSEKKGEKPASQSEESKKRQKYVRNGLIATSIGLLGGGLLVIGGKIGRENIRIPLRAEYLRIYGRVYPQSWVRY